MFRVPHPIPYQGSKRRLAPIILGCVPERIECLIEPFAGSAAVTLAAAARGLARRFVIGESLKPLASLWEMILRQPERLANEYESIWRDQAGNTKEHYFQIREEFNRGHDPGRLLYLLARCVKASVRFNSKGEFNQSPDNRRKGTHPDTMRFHILSAAKLLSGKCEVWSGDYAYLLNRATYGDLVYMDPPYQGVSDGRDSRYFEQLDIARFVRELEALNERNINYLISLDGKCGSRTYGRELPGHLQLTRLLVEVGRSSQSTLTGRSERTVESLYLSSAIAKRLQINPAYIHVKPPQKQLAMEF
ncbi:MAG: DNA adenine methylase [Thermodesulfobacteriota bacterium]